MNLSAVQSTLTNASYATGTQTIDSWSSIGGGGLRLLSVKGGTTNIAADATDGASAITPSAPVAAAPLTAGAANGATPPSADAPVATLPAVAAVTAVAPPAVTAQPLDPFVVPSTASVYVSPHAVMGMLSPMVRGGLETRPPLSSVSTLTRVVRPRFGLLPAESRLAASTPDVGIPEQWNLMHREYESSGAMGVGGSESESALHTVHVLDEPLVASAQDATHAMQPRPRNSAPDRRYA
jgi:hypothetical protein